MKRAYGTKRVYSAKGTTPHLESHSSAHVVTRASYYPQLHVSKMSKKGAQNNKRSSPLFYLDKNRNKAAVVKKMFAPDLSLLNTKRIYSAKGKTPYLESIPISSCSHACILQSFFDCTYPNRQKKGHRTTREVQSARYSASKKNKKQGSGRQKKL